MSSSVDLRASSRAPLETSVEVKTKDRMALYAHANNIGMGGMLLNATPALPLGSQCKVAIGLANTDDGKRFVTEGTVVRSDAQGVAIKFSKLLEEKTYAIICRPLTLSIGNYMINSYLNYFAVSQSRDLEGCEKLLGISKRNFKIVFLTSFFACIPLAILPVWIFKSNIPLSPNWVKISASFAYAAFWLLVIQPTIDLVVFRLLKTRKPDK